MPNLPTQKNALEFQNMVDCDPYFGEPIGDKPKQTFAVLHFDESNNVLAGIWECDKGRLALDIINAEFIHVLKGHWVLTSEDGEVTNVRAGDSSYLPVGWKGTGEILEPVRKVFTVMLN